MNIRPDNPSTDNSFHIASEQELILCFRPRDQKRLVVPLNLRFPIKVNSYYTWKESSGVYTYLIFKRPNWDAPRGVAFKRTPSTGEATGGLCSWCNSYGTSEEIGYLSVAMSAKVGNSYLICHDLSCASKIEQGAMLAGRDPDKYLISLFYRMEKLFENLTNHKLE